MSGGSGRSSFEGAPRAPPAAGAPGAPPVPPAAPAPFAPLRLSGAQVESLRKTISELDQVLAVGIAAWLKKRGKARRPWARQRGAARARASRQRVCSSGSHPPPHAPAPAQALRPKLSAEQKAQLMECFDLMDADGSGAIDADEMGAAFKARARGV